MEWDAGAGETRGAAQEVGRGVAARVEKASKGSEGRGDEEKTSEKDGTSAANTETGSAARVGQDY